MSAWRMPFSSLCSLPLRFKRKEKTRQHRTQPHASSLLFFTAGKTRRRGCSHWRARRALAPHFFSSSPFTYIRNGKQRENFGVFGGVVLHQESEPTFARKRGFFFRGGGPFSAKNGVLRRLHCGNAVFFSRRPRIFNSAAPFCAIEMNQVLRPENPNFANIGCSGAAQGSFFCLFCSAKHAKTRGKPHLLRILLPSKNQLIAPRN